MESKKRIALITTWFPPHNSVATNRMLSFVEFLSPYFEIDVYALNSNEEKISWNKNVTVYYSKSNQLIEFFKNNPKDSRNKHKVKTGINIILRKFIKNPLNSWKKSITQKLEFNHTVSAYDLIISSFSPQEAHLVAIDFCKKFHEVPWIADMRDEMSKNPNFSLQQRKFLSEIEYEINKFASCITTVSEPILEDFKLLCPNVLYFEEIRNGFNHDLKNLNKINEDTGTFKIGYFGTFYGDIKPHFFFEALSELLLNKELVNFEINLFGVYNNFTIPQNIIKFVNIKDKLPYTSAIEKMGEMNLNLLINPKTSRKGVFTGKLFDYISVQKPILALVDKVDVAAKLILEFECGYVAEYNNVEEIKSCISKAIDDWKLGTIKKATDEQKDSLHRKFQVEKMKLLIDKLTARK